MSCKSNQPLTDTILVADDRAANRELLEELLTVEGFKVASVSTGAAALEQLSILPIDLVLLDVMKPNLTGSEVCEKIKANSDNDSLIRLVDRTELLARVRSLLTLRLRTDERAESVLFPLARSIAGKTPYTRGHCQRLADCSAPWGEHLKLSKDQVTALRRAGVVHDIGKIAVPDSMILKPISLSPEEWRLMEEHPVVGERICAPLKSFRPVLPIIRYHKKFDGSGYPDGLAGKVTRITARVLQIVDVYDALTTIRPCKPPFSITDALPTMKMEVAKGWWDTHISSLFAQFVRSGTADFLSRGAGAGSNS